MNTARLALPREQMKDSNEVVSYVVQIFTT